MNSSATNDIITTLNEGLEPDSVMKSIIKNNPTSYIFGNSHSELWIDESNSNNSSMKRVTALQQSIIVTGYDTKTQIQSYVTLFPSGLDCDSRVSKIVNYLTVKYQYKKAISIPKGASLILPPQTVMSTFTPMGIKPGTTSGEFGYTMSFVSTDGTNDIYYLITEGNEITYNSIGQQVAPLDNPIYCPCKIITPSQITFKYQYSEVVW